MSLVFSVRSFHFRGNEETACSASDFHPIMLRTSADHPYPPLPTAYMQSSTKWTRRKHTSVRKLPPETTPNPTTSAKTNFMPF